MGSVRISIAVIGGGGLIGQRHCQHVVDNPRAQLCAIVDPRTDAIKAGPFGNTPCYTSVEELLSSPHKPDAAIVCTPNSTHVPVGIQLARAGVHILCEKPISINTHTAKTLVDVTSECGVRLLVGHHRRFNPYMRALKATVESGQLGTIVAVNGLWTTIKPPDYFAGANSWRKVTGSGGVVLINLIHDIDLMQLLFGPVTSVHAEKTKSQRSQDDNAVEEGAAILLKFQNGIVGTFLMSDNVASPHSFEQGTGENPNLPRTGADVYRIFGSHGSISFPDMTLSSYRGGTRSWNEVMTNTRLPVEQPDEAPLAAQLDHFIDVCLGVDEPTCSGTEAMRALAVCEAVQRALQTGGLAQVDIGL